MDFYLPRNNKNIVVTLNYLRLWGIIFDMKTRVGDSWSSVLISALERASLTGVKRVVLVPSTVPFTPPALLLWLTESPSVFIEKFVLLPSV